MVIPPNESRAYSSGRMRSGSTSCVTRGASGKVRRASRSWTASWPMARGLMSKRYLLIWFENSEQVYYCHMSNPDLPPITEGRIGLRHMWTRSSRYKSIRISKPE
ncbi:MAG: hypothetical protein QGF00_11985 [Planctomycetota bacterium]|nr:hypothetical protein [Planctomycetota bacterium]